MLLAELTVRHTRRHIPTPRGAGRGPGAELAAHGLHPVPQLLGAVMAAADMASYPRQLALRAIEGAIERPGVLPDGITARWVTHVQQGAGTFSPGPAAAAPGKGRATDVWWGVPAERRWAMEVFGFGPDSSPEREDVLRRFRRLVRLAHPDHGAAHGGAAERIVELGEARRVLLHERERVRPARLGPPARPERAAAMKVTIVGAGFYGSTTALPGP